MNTITLTAEDREFLRDIAAELDAHSMAGAIRFLRALAAREPTPCACRWEADHQRAALEAYGLADRFPFGCDAIDHVAEALIQAERERDEARAEVARQRQELAEARAEIQEMESDAEIGREVRRLEAWVQAAPQDARQVKIYIMGDQFGAEAYDYRPEHPAYGHGHGDIRKTTTDTLVEVAAVAKAAEDK